jgi:hypothetical protein
MSERILLIAMLICCDQSRAQIFLAGYVHDSVVNHPAIEHPAEAQQAHVALNMFNLEALLFYSLRAFPQSRVAVRDPKGTVLHGETAVSTRPAIMVLPRVGRRV